MEYITPDMTVTKINYYLKHYRDVTFKAGEYHMNKCMILYSDTNVICEDGVTFIREHIGRMLQSYNSPTTIQYRGVANVSWTGGHFIANSRIEKANVLTFFHCSNITLKNITVEGCIGYHSLEINASKNVDVLDCRFINQKPMSYEKFREAIQLDFANYDGLKISGADSTSSCYDGTHCQNVLIQNCIFEDVPNGVGTHTVSQKESYHKNITIDNCMFTNVTYTDIKLYGMSGVTITKNKCNTILLGRLKKAHANKGGKVDLDNYRKNEDITIDVNGGAKINIE